MSISPNKRDHHQSTAQTSTIHKLNSKRQNPQIPQFAQRATQLIKHDTHANNQEIHLPILSRISLPLQRNNITTLCNKNNKLDQVLVINHKFSYKCTLFISKILTIITTPLQNQTLSNKTTVNFTGYIQQHLINKIENHQHKLLQYILADAAKYKIPKFHNMQDDLNMIHHDK